jgi:hypothetical protein
MNGQHKDLYSNTSIISTWRLWEFETQVFTKWQIKKLQISRYKFLTLRMDRPRFLDLCFNKKIVNFCLALHLAFVVSCYAKLLLKGANLLQKLGCMLCVLVQPKTTTKDLESFENNGSTTYLRQKVPSSTAFAKKIVTWHKGIIKKYLYKT